jgi:hypothetical protein
MIVPATDPVPGLPPGRSFNVEDVLRMLDAGVIREQERFELIEGEIVVMSPKSVVHDDIQNALNLALARAVPERFYVGNGSTLQLAENILVEPDLRDHIAGCVQS